MSQVPRTPEALKKLAANIEDQAVKLLEASERLAQQGDRDRALQGVTMVVAFLDSCAPLLDRVPGAHRDMVARALHLNAKILTETGNHESAAMFHEEMIRRFGEVNDPKLQIYVAEARVRRLCQGLKAAREHIRPRMN